MRTQTSRAQRVPRSSGKPRPGNGAAADNKFEQAMPCFEQQLAGTAAGVREFNGSDGQYEATASSCGDGKGRAREMARPLRLQCSDCEELLHRLASVMTGVLMQSQLVAWKLPPYSHLKRSVREIERNAQRGSELMKRIMRRIGDDDEPASGEDAASTACARNGPESRPHKRV